MEVVWQSSAPAGRGPHMAVMLTNDVVFNICPAVVRIIMATLQTLPKAEVSPTHFWGREGSYQGLAIPLEKLVSWGMGKYVG